MRRKLVIGFVVVTMALLAAYAGKRLNTAMMEVPEHLVVLSDDGAYRYIAGSPDRDRNEPAPRDHRHALIDAHTGEAQWKRVFNHGYEEPFDAWIHDDAHVAVLTSMSQVCFLSPRNGGILWSYDAISALPADDRREHVHYTTAGPRWRDHSTARFLEVDGLLLFVHRMGWGHRLVASVTEGTLIEPDPVMLRRIIEAENTEALARLRAVVDNLGESDREDYRADPDLFEARASAWAAAQDAMIVLAQNGVREAIPLIRTMERYEPSTTDRTLSPDALTMPEGARIVFWTRAERFIAQMCLRLLGEPVAPLASTDPHLYEADHTQTRIDVPPLAHPRADRAGDVVVGTSFQELLGLVGPPDHEHRWEPHFVWEYHIDDDPPYTLRLTFAWDGTVLTRDEVTPPSWQGQGEWFRRVRRP